MSDVTTLLSAITKGDPHAAADLLPLVYDELRRLASAMLAQEAPGQTLQPTALVHEAYVRLTGNSDQDPDWDNRRHFFAAAESMRRLIIENANARSDSSVAATGNESPWKRPSRSICKARR